MKRRSQSNTSSSLQHPPEEHPEVEEAESSKAKRATSSWASGNKKATKAPVKWTKLHIKKQKEPDAKVNKYRLPSIILQTVPKIYTQNKKQDSN